MRKSVLWCFPAAAFLSSTEIVVPSVCLLKQKISFWIILSMFLFRKRLRREVADYQELYFFFKGSIFRCFPDLKCFTVWKKRFMEVVKNHSFLHLRQKITLCWSYFNNWNLQKLSTWRYIIHFLFQLVIITQSDMCSQQYEQLLRHSVWLFNACATDVLGEKLDDYNSVVVDNVWKTIAC